VVETGLQRAGVRLSSLRIAMELDSTEAMLSCIEAGLGVGIVSKWALDRRLRAHSLVTVRIEGQQITRTFSFVLAQGPVVQPAVETMMRFLQNAVPAVSKVLTKARIDGGPIPLISPIKKKR
jgi:DNA-binding transcriptional LysR family regulator